MLWAQCFFVDFECSFVERERFPGVELLRYVGQRQESVGYVGVLRSDEFFFYLE